MTEEDIKSLNLKNGFYYIELNDQDPDFKVGKDVVLISVYGGNSKFRIKTKKLLKEYKIMDDDGYLFVYPEAVEKVIPIEELFEGLLE